MASTPTPLTEIDAKLNKIGLELVTLARTFKAGEVFRLVMNAAYQIEQARSVLFVERPTAGDKDALAGEDLAKEAAQAPDHTPSPPGRHKQVVTTLQQVEHNLTDFITEMERAAPMNQRGVSVYLAAEGAVKAIAHLRQLLDDF